MRNSRVSSVIGKSILHTFVSVIIIGLFLAVFSMDTFAKEEYNYQELIEDIFESGCNKYQVDGVQELVDEVFSEDASNGTIQTFVTAIYKYDIWNTDFELDYSKYIESLINAADKKEEMSVFQLQKSSIVLNMLGVENDVIQYTLENTIGEKGIMSYVTGLKLLNAVELESSAISTNEVIDKLIEYQLEDGGFANTGNVGDVDVTAMTIQVLAKYYDTNENVRNCIDRALVFLSEEQLEDGGFASYGKACSESASQVLMALDSLEFSIDEQTFVKNNQNVIDGLLKYQLSDGAFGHIDDGNANEMASAQAVEALVNIANNYEYESVQGVNSIFVGKGKNENSENNIKIHNSTIDEEREILENDNLQNENEKVDIKLITSKNLANSISIKIIIAAIILIFGIIYIIVKARKDKKKFISACIIMIGCIALVLGINIQSKNEYLNTKEDGGTKETINVTIEIRCDTIIGKTPTANKTNIDKYIPEDGTILEKISVEISSEATVSELLQQACKDNGIQLEQEGNGKLGYAYVKGIQYLYELDYGDISGWMYRVNGEFPSVGCGEYKLEDGDEVQWLYTCELGRDIGDEWD